MLTGWAQGNVQLSGTSAAALQMTQGWNNWLFSVPNEGCSVPDVAQTAVPPKALHSTQTRHGVLSHLHKHGSVWFGTAHSVRQIKYDSLVADTVSGAGRMFTEAWEKVPTDFVYCCQEGLIASCARACSQQGRDVCRQT